MDALCEIGQDWAVQRAFDSCDLVVEMGGSVYEGPFGADFLKCLRALDAPKLVMISPKNETFL